MIRNPLKQLFRSFLLASCIMVLVISLIPSQVVHADTFTSDLAIRLISAPRHAKACQVFDATFEITNYGPDTAIGVYVGINAPDQLGVLDIQGVPDALLPGEIAIVTATVKVVSFVPGEFRQGWIGADIYSDRYPDTSLDPNDDNNHALQALKFIGKRQSGCP